MSINFGCQGSTWVLDYDEEADVMDQIMDDMQGSGFKGLDMQFTLLGKYENNPASFKEELDKRGLQLAALTIPHAFQGGKSSDEELDLQKHYFNYIKYFPEAILNIPSRIGQNRDNLLQRQKEIIIGANELGKRASDHGIITSLHPISYKTSYWIYKEDYDVLFDGLDSRYMGYTPDAGHIMFGGMNPVEIIKVALPLIKHVHYKDASENNVWKKMGEGAIDFEACTTVLKDSGYNGWIMFEEETGSEQSDVGKVVAEMDKYLKAKLLPIIKG